MRITLVISSLSAGGAERVITTMANHWAEKGYVVNLLTLASGEEVPFYRLQPAVHHWPLGVASNSKNIVQGILRNVTRVRALRRAIRQTRPQVVVALMSETNVLTLLATAGIKVPVVVQEQNNPFQHRIGLHWDTLRHWIYRRATHVITLNDHSLTYFSKKVRQRGRIIPNFADVSGEPRVPFSRRGQPKTVIAMGRLDFQKGFDMLLEAYAKVAHRHPQWSLEILGEGPLRGNLESLVRNLGLETRVRMPGTTKEPFTRFRSADLFVMSSRYEGVPLSLCEAMACGLPAVSFDCPTGPGDIIRHGVDGLLVPPGDIDAFSTAMDELMREDARREELAAKAPEVLSRYGAQEVMNMWDMLVNEVTAREQPQGNVQRQPIRIFFLIRSLEPGGAERQLTELVKRLNRMAQFRITVATFYDGGLLRPEVEGLDGVRVLSLGKTSRWDMLPTINRLMRAVREERPHIIHGYMGVANELALLMGRAFGAKVVWGMRASRMDKSKVEWLSALSFRAGALLSRFADVLIANSHAGRKDYVAEGYSAERFQVISNGIDTARFRPDAEAREKVRSELGVADTQRLVGLVGRLNPQKDHPNFLHAAALLAKRFLGLRFVCVGNGPAEYRDELEKLADDLGLGAQVIWLRARGDMPAVYNALDLLTLPSAYGEGFPNVVGEAMACGIPVVVTDVGDAAMIVGNRDQVVPARDPEALADTMERILRLDDNERSVLVRTQRERLVREFSLEHLTARTAATLEQLV